MERNPKYTFTFTFDELYSFANIIRERPMSDAETRAVISNYLRDKDHEEKIRKQNSK